jgi:hypothetical protein
MLRLRRSQQETWAEGIRKNRRHAPDAVVAVRGLLIVRSIVKT